MNFGTRGEYDEEIRKRISKDCGKGDFSEECSIDME